MISAYLKLTTRPVPPNRPIPQLGRFPQLSRFPQLGRFHHRFPQTGRFSPQLGRLCNVSFTNGPIAILSVTFPRANTTWRKSKCNLTLGTLSHTDSYNFANITTDSIFRLEYGIYSVVSEKHVYFENLS